MTGIILGFLGLLIVLGLILAFLVLGAAAVLALSIIFLLWLGTLVYYVFIHQDHKPSDTSYSIDQGKESK